MLREKPKCPSDLNMRAKDSVWLVIWAWRIEFKVYTLARWFLKLLRGYGIVLTAQHSSLKIRPPKSILFHGKKLYKVKSKSKRWAEPITAASRLFFRQKNSNWWWTGWIPTYIPPFLYSTVNIMIYIRNNWREEWNSRLETFRGALLTRSHNKQWLGKENLVGIDERMTIRVSLKSRDWDGPVMTSIPHLSVGPKDHNHPSVRT